MWNQPIPKYCNPVTPIISTAFIVQNHLDAGGGDRSQDGEHTHRRNGLLQENL